MQTKACFRCTQMSASKLSFAKIALWVGPLSTFPRTYLLMLSAVACGRRLGHISVSFGSLIMFLMALFFCTIVGGSGED